MKKALALILFAFITITPAQEDISAEPPDVQTMPCATESNESFIDEIFSFFGLAPDLPCDVPPPPPDEPVEDEF